jgi:outer membrane protein assembly factor BamB
VKSLVRSCFVSLAVAGLTMALAVCAASAAGDWPQWRGVNRDGYSTDTGLLKQWPDGGPKLLWSAKGLGAGYTNLGLVGEHLYTMGDLGSSSFLIAINPADRKIHWKTKAGKSGAPGWGGLAGPRCTPTVDGKSLEGVDL